MRICDAKDCKTGRWTIRMFIKVKNDRVKLLMIFIFVKISVKSKYISIISVTESIIFRK